LWEARGNLVEAGRGAGFRYLLGGRAGVVGGQAEACVASMASRRRRMGCRGTLADAIDATVSPRPRLLDGVDVTDSL
jgi:hypothetical protein